MTRGKFFLITEDLLLSSIEFNGDVYLEGKGNLAFELLKFVNSTDDFINIVSFFNKLLFNYPYSDLDLIGSDSLKNFDRYKNFNKDYFYYWSSDWLFFKNISSKEVKFILKNKDEFILKPYETIRFYFGNL